MLLGYADAKCLYKSIRTKLLAKLQGLSVFLNLALAVATIIGLPIARRHDLNEASYTFGGLDNLSSWPDGFSFILSWLAPVWTICEFFPSLIPSIPVFTLLRFVRLPCQYIRGGLKRLDSSPLGDRRCRRDCKRHGIRHPYCCGFDHGVSRIDSIQIPPKLKIWVGPQQ
jgi:hypothetical protein